MGGFCQQLITAVCYDRPESKRHTQKHCNACLHIFPIKIVSCVIHKLRNANGKKADYRLHHVYFHQHKQSIVL